MPPRELNIIAAGYNAGNCDSTRASTRSKSIILRVAAHGSDPAAGEDAILEIGLFLQSLKQCQAQLPIDDLLCHASRHHDLIRGGEEPSSYP